MRRDAKQVWNSLYYTMRREWVVSDLETYLQLERAFRGGNTHANRFFVAPETELPIVTTGVHSYDRASSYPDVMCNMRFPLGKWKREPGIFDEKIIQRMRKWDKAFVFDVTFYNIRLKDTEWGCPYISKDKCWNLRKQLATNAIKTKHTKKEAVTNHITDNGRIICADELETTITDIDYWIIEHEYEWESIQITNLKYCRYQYLPKPFVELVQKYFKNKTELKGIDEQKWLYNESKSKINSLYGMSAQKTIREQVTFTNSEFITQPGDAQKALQFAEKRAFLPYSVGVWVTAWARYWLERAIILIHETPGADFLYTDTDSVKFTGNVDFTSLNNEIMEQSKKTGSYAKDIKGKIHYMGVYEYEGTYDNFASMGAKKYLYTDSKGLHLTISGVVKYDENGHEISADELLSLGGISAFRSGTVFSKAGGLEAVYNDDPLVKEIQIEGHTLIITRNVCLRPSTYTLGLAGEYNRLLEMLIIGIDNPNLL